MNTTPVRKSRRKAKASPGNAYAPGKQSAHASASSKDAATEDVPAGAGSIFKALHILERIVETPTPVSVAELATTLGLSKPTTHRIATFLEEFGFLEREPDGRRFIESQRLVDLSLNVLFAAAQRPNRHGILEWVVEQTGETCNLGIMDHGELVYLDRVEAEWPLGLRFEPGSRVPLHCTAIGKLFLSMQSDENLEALLKTLRLTKYTDTTKTDPATLRSSLSEIRKAGVSIDNQEFMSGVVCIAVPVLDPAGRIRAGLAISAPEARVSATRVLEYAPVLRAAAARMQAAMFARTGEDDAGMGELLQIR
ncbi:MAG: IclR family transcriptional regulator [Hyphomicrobiaceae bacterium]|nr:IclR family transcriptional regulator [Hyphomicrobiaceae bacterium]